MTIFRSPPCYEQPCQLTLQLQTRLKNLEDELIDAQHSTGRNMAKLYSNYVREIREAAVQLKALDDVLAEERIKHLDEKESLQRCIEQLHQKMIDADSEIHKMELQNAQFINRDMRISDEALCAAVNENETLLQKLNELKDVRTRMGVMRDQLERKIESHRLDSEKWMLEFEKAMKDNDKKDNEMEKLRIKMDILSRESNERQINLQTYITKLTDELSKKICVEETKFEDAKTHLLEEIRKHSEHIKDLKLQLMDVSRRYETSEETVRALHVETDTLKRELSNSVSEIEHFKLENRRTKEELQAVVNEKEEIQSDLSRKTFELDRLKKDFENTENDFIESQTKLASERKIHQELSQIKESFFTENQKLNSQLETERIDRQRVIVELTQLQQQMNIEKSILVNEKNRLLHEDRDIKTQLSELTKKIQEQASDSLNVQLDEASRLRKHDMEAETLKKAKKDLLEESESLRFQLMEAEMRERSLKREKSEAEHQLSLFKVKYDRTNKRQEERIANLQYESGEVNRLIDEIKDLARRFPNIASQLLAHVNRLQIHTDELNLSFEKGFVFIPSSNSSTPLSYVKKEVGEMSYVSTNPNSSYTSPVSLLNSSIYKSKSFISPSQFTLI
eukprot:GHVL01034248.1.p1 GENE.GHVL01034248.1~~GHVL01034248.1.p1  ORF type:complete len:622 (-),score=139.38 GHVL01034248.1:805-2670(-)